MQKGNFSDGFDIYAFVGVYEGTNSFTHSQLPRLSLTLAIVKRSYFIFTFGLFIVISCTIAFICGREPNFELTVEEKDELSQLSWDDFLAMTRSAINSKSKL